MFLHYSPDLLSSFDGLAGEEGYPGEAEILVHGEHPHSQQVGLTQVVDEAANVAKESRIDTVNISHLHEIMTRERTVYEDGRNEVQVKTFCFFPQRWFLLL